MKNILVEFFSEKYVPEVEKRYRVYKVGGIWSNRVWGVYPFHIGGLPPFNRVAIYRIINIIIKRFTQ